MQEKSQTPESALPHMPDAETIRLELGKARSINDLTGKDGVSARPVSYTHLDVYKRQVLDRPANVSMLLIGIQRGQLSQLAPK